ncbi:unnamed protein product [Musa banksii]
MNDAHDCGACISILDPASLGLYTYGSAAADRWCGSPRKQRDKADLGVLGSGTGALGLDGPVVVGAGEWQAGCCDDERRRVAHDPPKRGCNPTPTPPVNSFPVCLVGFVLCVPFPSGCSTFECISFHLPLFHLRRHGPKKLLYGA